MRLEYRAVIDLCKKCGVEVPANVRVDQQLATRLIDQCTAVIAGLVNPSDATATAADITKNKTAYGAAGKMTGTSVAVDTSDADATAADIAKGKTAYVKGVKIVGTKE